MKKRLKIAFLLDPLKTWDTDGDTSFSLMLECRRRGHSVHAIESKDLLLFRGFPHARARELELSSGGAFSVRRTKFAGLRRFDALIIRKEPPFDAGYLGATYFLEPLRKRLFMMNDPAGIRDVNEKISVLYFPGLGPRSAALFSEKELPRAARFIRGRELVLKRVDQKGGVGVLKSGRHPRTLAAHFRSVSDGGRAPAVLQEFVPHRLSGDKRILLLKGRPIGAFTRIPGPKDFRANMTCGGKAARASLDARDRKIIRALRPFLDRKGLSFVGLDVLDGRLSEINVTSPAGIPEINALERTRLERPVVDFIERAV